MYELKAGARAKDPYTLDLSWIGTGDLRDTYSVWTRPKGDISDGNLIAAGCGATRYLSRQDLTIQETADNQFSATVRNVDRKEKLLLTVVVEREGGYIASYQGVTTNGVSSLSMGILSIISVMCFFLL
jgi:hypothetical protein